MKRNILYMCLLLVFIGSCSTKSSSYFVSKSQTFERKKAAGIEQFKINFEKQIFTFYYKENQQNFIGNGKIVKNESAIFFEFPAFSEYAKLPFFPSEYWELNYIDTSSKFEVDISIIDVETKEEIESKIPIYVSPIKGTTVNKFANNKKIVVTTSLSKLKLILDRMPFKENDVIEIPTKGKYELIFNLLKPRTDILFETTTEGCSMITYNPKVKMLICKCDDGDIISFDTDESCSDQFVANYFNENKALPKN